LKRIKEPIYAGRKITEPLVNKFWDAVCQAAEENGIMLGGGFEPTNES